MRRAFGLLMLLVGLVPGAAAYAQQGDQIFPPDGQLKLIDRATDDGAFLFVETRTAGRAGDYGYAWSVLLRVLPGSTFEAMRHQFDCAGEMLRSDWRTVFGADFRPATQDDTISTTPIADLDPGLREIGRLACAGTPLAPDHLSLADAAAWAATMPANVAEPELDDIVNVTETGPGGTYRASWTRRPGSSTYDGVWLFEPTGEKTTGTVAFHQVINGMLTIERPGMGTYAIPYFGAFPQKGTASWMTDPGAGVTISVWDTVPDVTADPPPAKPAETVPDTGVLTPLGFDPRDVPPLWSSLVQINEFNISQPTRVYFDEKSPVRTPGKALTWQFYSYKTPSKQASGALSVGAWLRVDYDCNEPISAHPVLVVPLLEDFTRASSWKAKPARWTYAPGTVEDQVARFACFGEPMTYLEFVHRYEGVSSVVNLGWLK